MSERDPDPRSPRPSAGNLPGTGGGDDNGPPRGGQAGGGGGGTSPSPAPAPVPGIPLGPPGFPPVFIGDRPPPPPRNSLSSMMMMLMFFFFMSNGNPPHHIVTGPDGEIAPRVTELDLARQRVGEYRGYLNGTGNWTEPATPSLLPSSLVPPRFDHSSSAAAGHHFFNNMTGWYRRATAHPIDLVAATPSAPFFDGVSVPSLNTSSWNATLAAELRGEFDWASVVTFDMNNVKERPVSTFMSTNVTSPDGEDGLDPSKWAWVRGTIVLTASGEVPPGQRRIPPQGNRDGHQAADGEDSSTDLLSPVETYAEYSFYGLHFVPNGTYELYALPDGLNMDIRHIPTLFKDQHNVTAQIVLAQLEKELRQQEESLLLTDVKPDEPTRTRCPLLIHLSLPPLPPGAHLADLLAYEAELANPTGILSSLQRPPHYWDGLGLGGVVIADQCGWAFGVDHGKGVLLDDFWRKSINYAAYATLAQLMVLVLLVRQMEATRTPSTLAKVSLWTIVILGVTDSWIFSAHLVIGVMTDNKTGLPMLVPGFCALCTAIVFGPRYAVLLHRIQAPERTVTRPTPTLAPTGGGNGTPTGTGAGTGAGADTGTGTTTTDTPSESMGDRLMNALAANRGLQWIGGVALMFIMFQLVLVPSIVPFVLFAIYSIWVPQIWRNARRGSSRALSHAFVVGTSVGRLALPLYALACPENVFFVEVVDWVWGLVLWQVVQVSVLFAQDRFGPCFFLPKRFKPAEGYDYHPLLPVADEENVLGSGLGTGPRATWFEGGTTCSICMEDVDTHPVDPEGGAPSALLGLNARRSYAVAPCHHLFHTKCLAQWMAIKTICPLCKRPLPPL